MFFEFSLFVLPYEEKWSFTKVSLEIINSKLNKIGSFDERRKLITERITRTLTERSEGVTEREGETL